MIMFKLLRRPVGAALGVMLCCSASGATTTGYGALVRRVAPSVVTVLVEEQRISAGQRAANRAIGVNDNEAMAAMLRRLLSGPADMQGPGGPTIDGASSSLGSGFIIRADGIIITNRHVIEGAQSVKVRLYDGREVAATIVGADAPTDIAVLKVDAGVLPALQLGVSDNIAVGEAVIAIGNPFGLGQSVTAGIVSARGRTLEDDPYIDFLQTDAAINRGNSGGPLLSADGTVVGVTSNIFSTSGGSIGLGFAIPAETAAAVARQIEDHGHVERGYLGISAQAMTPALAAGLGMKTPQGALVTSLDPSGPAAEALAIGDVLLSIDAAAVSFKNLSKITARLAPNSLVTLTLLRDGMRIPVALKIGRLPDIPSDPALLGGQDTWVEALGLGVADTTAQIRTSIKAADEPNGLIITQLRPVGLGARAGLKVGDLITHLRTKQLTGPSDIASIERPTPEQPLLLRMVREGSPTYIAITGADDR
jgi:serine protease Do